jgi:hypothetical protein
VTSALQLHRDMKTERTIRNCSPRMSMVCPRTWDALRPTEHADVRHCEQCQEHVFLCLTDAETIAHARAGHCIARALPRASEQPRLVLGRPKNAERPTPSQLEAQEWMRRERAIDGLLRGGIPVARRTCSECSYPVPDYLDRCRVCGTKLGPLSG